MNWTEEQFRIFVRNGGSARSDSTKPPAKPRAARTARARGRHTIGRMNATETAYAGVLEPLRLAGYVAHWRHEAIKLVLVPPVAATDSPTGKRVPGVEYLADFWVVMADGLVEIHELKGSRRDARGRARPHWEDDSRVKWKMAAELFPELRFRAVWRVDGEWQEEARP